MWSMFLLRLSVGSVSLLDACSVAGIVLSTAGERWAEQTESSGSVNWPCTGPEGDREITEQWGCGGGGGDPRRGGETPVRSPETCLPGDRTGAELLSCFLCKRNLKFSSALTLPYKYALLLHFSLPFSFLPLLLLFSSCFCPLIFSD